MRRTEHVISFDIPYIFMYSRENLPDEAEALGGKLKSKLHLITYTKSRARIRNHEKWGEDKRR